MSWAWHVVWLLRSSSKHLSHQLTLRGTAWATSCFHSMVFQILPQANQKSNFPNSFHARVTLLASHCFRKICKSAKTERPSSSAWRPPASQAVPDPALWVEVWPPHTQESRVTRFALGSSSVILFLTLRLHLDSVNRSYFYPTPRHRVIQTQAVFQITLFCTKHFIFWVRKCAKCVLTGQCTTHALKTVQILSVWRWTLHTLNKRHVADVAEAISQTSHLSKWQQRITAEGFLAPLTWRLWMSPCCTDASYTCFYTKHHYVYILLSDSSCQ